MIEPSSEFAHQLRALREAQGYSIRALASLVGVSSVTIWKWEKGESKPRARMLAPLARALHVPTSVLGASTHPVEPSAAGDETFRPAEPRPAALPHPGQDRPGYAETTGQAGPTEPLADVIARAKQMISQASGTAPDSITILIEY